MNCRATFIGFSAVVIYRFGGICLDIIQPKLSIKVKQRLFIIRLISTTVDRCFSSIMNINKATKVSPCIYLMIFSVDCQHTFRIRSSKHIVIILVVTCSDRTFVVNIGSNVNRYIAFCGNKDRHIVCLIHLIDTRCVNRDDCLAVLWIFNWRPLCQIDSIICKC